MYVRRRHVSFPDTEKGNRAFEYLNSIPRGTASGLVIKLVNDYIDSQEKGISTQRSQIEEIVLDVLKRMDVSVKVTDGNMHVEVPEELDEEGFTGEAEKINEELMILLGE